MNFRFIAIFFFSYLFLLCHVEAGVFPNIHTVEAGKLYRSGQLSRAQIHKYVKQWKIKTIINLRGEAPGVEWYDDEVLASKLLGVDHYSIKMSASRLPHREDILTLIDLFETAQKPILIHCKGGADRTGEAVAMYMIDYMGYSNEKAMQKAQSIFTFHLESRFPAKKYFIGEIYRGKDWARQYYDPCDGHPYYDPKYCQ